jgi:hypothetical protein
MSGPYTDYRFKTTDLARALQAFGLFANGLPPMLGPPILDGGGNVVGRGRQGTAAAIDTDPDTGQAVSVPAAGDPTQWYFALRLATPLPFAPADYGLVECDPTEMIAVLGVWQ